MAYPDDGGDEAGHDMVAKAIPRRRLRAEPRAGVVVARCVAVGRMREFVRPEDVPRAAWCVHGFDAMVAVWPTRDEMLDACRVFRGEGGTWRPLDAPAGWCRPIA